MLKQNKHEEVYQQRVQPIRAATQLPTVCADASALSPSFAVRISLSLYAAACGQAPVKHNTYTATIASAFCLISTLFQSNSMLGELQKVAANVS